MSFRRGWVACCLLAVVAAAGCCAEQPVRTFQFGKTGSGPKDGVARIGPGDAYSGEKGYGWTLLSTAQGTDPDKTEPRGFMTATLLPEGGTPRRSDDFRVDLSPGDYRVIVTSGRGSLPVPPFRLYAEGRLLGEVSSPKGVYTTKEYPVRVLDGRLELGFGYDERRDLRNWTVNSVEIVPVRIFTELRGEAILEAPRQIAAPRLASAPVIDGRLGSEEWRGAEQSSDFFLNTPSLALAEKPTAVRIGRDNENLYIGFECLGVAAPKARKAPAPSDYLYYVFTNDCVEVFIMPKPEEKAWYHIAVDAAGQAFIRRSELKDEKDRTSAGDMLRMIEFSNNIRYAVSVTGEKWCAEIAIPFADLGARGPSEGWRLNLCREAPTVSEFSAWSRLVKEFNNPERFGRLTFSGGSDYDLAKAVFSSALQDYRNDLEVRRMQAELARTGSGYKFKYAFSFGPEEKPIQPGYRRVGPGSLYSRASGFGWEDGRGIVAEYNPCSGQLGRGEIFYTGELGAGCLKGKPETPDRAAENTFRVDLPNGEYKVYMLTGEAVSVQAGRRRHRFEVYAQGSHLFPIDVGDLVFAEPVFRTTVKDGTFRLTLKGGRVSLPLEPELRELYGDETRYYEPGWLLNALVIYPAGERKAAEAQLNRDLQDFRLLPVEKLIGFKHRPAPVEEPLKDATAAEKRTGFVLFNRGTGVPVFKTSAPQRSEISNTLAVRVAAGETTNAALCVYPLRDVDQLRVKPGELRGPAGVIPASSIEAGVVKSLPYPIGAEYMQLPYYVEPLTYADTDLSSGETFQLWFTLRTPADAKPGLYTGEIALSSAGGPGSTARLSVEVLPFQLLDSPQKRFGIYFPEGYNSSFMHRYEMLLDMRDHGMNNVELNGVPIKRTPFTPKEIERGVRQVEAKLALAARAGLRGPVPMVFFFETPEGTELTEVEKQNLKLILGAVHQMTKEKGLQEVLFYAWDELHTVWMRQVARETYKTAKEVPGARTYETCTPISMQTIADYLDVPCLDKDASDFRAYRVSEAQRRAGKELWAYPFHPASNTDKPAGIRFLYGWFGWSVGIDGYMPWAYTAYGTNPYNHLGDPHHIYTVVYPNGVGGHRLLPSLCWEMARLGINDQRYIYTLSTLIEEAKRSSNESARAMAEEEERRLNKICDSVHGGITYYDANGYWDPKVYDLLRERLVAGILELSKALGR